jgi:spermidine synthase
LDAQAGVVVREYLLRGQHRVVDLFSWPWAWGGVGGRLADRAKNPLALYGVFELIIGAWALVFLLLVTRGETWAVPLLQQLHGSRGIGIGVRAVLAAVLLLPPCFLMGATLPLLAKFVNREPRVQGLKIGFLYTANTIGAAVGCYVAGFQLLPQLGYFQATLVAAATNAVVGILALGISLMYRPGHAEAAAGVEKSDTPMSPRLANLVLAAFGVSGFVALALEVLWTRLLVIGFLGTTYAYTTMLTVLLSGLVVGGAVGSLIVRGGRARIAWLGGAMGLCAAASLYLLVRIAAIPAGLQEYGNDWTQMMEATFTLSAIALFPSAFLFGITFPIAVTLLGRARATLGRDLGAMYAVNTICGMLGAIAGGYIIIPLLGTHVGILALAFVLLATGLIVLLSCPVSDGRLKGTLAGTTVALFGVAYALGPTDVMKSLNTGYVPEADHIIHFAEHTEGTVAVSAPKEYDTGSERVLWINRVQATASIVKGVKMNRFQGVLPLLFDRGPENVLFMCFGSGITCGTLALSDFAKIDAVEINPGVLEAAPLFARDNLNVLERPNVHTHIDDGRNFLLTSTEKYDLITFEPMPLALAGVSTFYTEEYYRLCRARLAPRGLVSQWIPLHSLTPEIVKGLRQHFSRSSHIAPHGSSMLTCFSSDRTSRCCWISMRPVSVWPRPSLQGRSPPLASRIPTKYSPPSS